MKVSELPETLFCPTGSYVLDFITSGGIPKGKIIEFFGKPSSGKSSISLLIAKKFLEEGGKVLYFDLEKGLTKEYADKFKLNGNFEILYTDSGEDCLNTSLKQTNKVDLIIIDSVPFLLPQKDVDSLGQRARLVTKFLEKLVFKNDKTTFILLNQIRSNFQGQGGFFAAEESSNINALKHAAHLRLHFCQKDFIRKKGEKVGQRITVKVVKSKVGIPQLSGEVVYNFRLAQLEESEDILIISQVFELLEKVEGSYVVAETGEKINGRAIKGWIDKNKKDLKTKLDNLLKEYLKAVRNGSS